MNQSRFISVLRKYGNVGWRFTSSSTTIKQVDRNNLEQDTLSLIETQKENMPVQMENPYQKEKKQCILCKYEITPDYKNTRLLSQFISRFTGKIYGRHITGLCKRQQRAVEREIYRAIGAGLMAGYFREPRFAHDPKLFNPDNPFRPHRF